MEQCQTLREYAIYVDRVRTYAKVMDLSTAVKKAIDECIQEGILEEFLRANRAEVIAMSIFEYDEEFEMKKLRQAEFDAGYDSGKLKGQLDERLKNQKEFTFSLAKRNFSPQDIAEILNLPVETIQMWLNAQSQNVE